jgi:hypothetical protein
MTLDVLISYQNHTAHQMQQANGVDDFFLKEYLFPKAIAMVFI